MQHGQSDLDVLDRCAALCKAVGANGYSGLRQWQRLAWHVLPCGARGSGTLAAMSVSEAVASVQVLPAAVVVVRPFVCCPAVAPLTWLARIESTQCYNVTHYEDSRDMSNYAEPRSQRWTAGTPQSRCVSLECVSIGDRYEVHVSVDGVRVFVWHAWQLMSRGNTHAVCAIQHRQLAVPVTRDCKARSGRHAGRHDVTVLTGAGRLRASTLESPDVLVSLVNSISSGYHESPPPSTPHRSPQVATPKQSRASGGVSTGSSERRKRPRKSLAPGKFYDRPTRPVGVTPVNSLRRRSEPRSVPPHGRVARHRGLLGLSGNFAASVGTSAISSMRKRFMLYDGSVAARARPTRPATPAASTPRSTGSAVGQALAEVQASRDHIRRRRPAQSSIAERCVRRARHSRLTAALCPHVWCCRKPASIRTATAQRSLVKYVV